jgi:C4-dicarboxylate transporter DctM subunit
MNVAVGGQRHRAGLWVPAVLLILALAAALAFQFSAKVTLFLLLTLALLFLKQPIVLILAVCTAYVHAFLASKSSVEYLVQDMWFTVDREILLSIPMFILAGALMTGGSIARRLVNIMKSMTAPIPGGLAIATVLACGVFAGISGSSIVTMLAVGTIMYPALVEDGYDRPFAIGLVCSAGTLGVMIPPSIPMILYGIVTETSITKLFIAGIGPGLMLILLFSVYSFATNRSRPTQRLDLMKVAIAWKEGALAVFLPVLLLGGIYSGHFSPTESAAISLLYALVVEVFVHRELKLHQFKEIALSTVRMLGMLLPLLAICTSLNTILDYEGIAKAWVAYVGQNVTSPAALMLGINILLLIVGCLMEVSSAIMVLAPLLFPMAMNAGYDPVHFGIIMTANLEIGYLTPPVGLNLIVAMGAFRESFGMIVRAVLPFIVIMLAWLALVASWPPLAMTLLK